MSIRQHIAKWRFRRGRALAAAVLYAAAACALAQPLPAPVVELDFDRLAQSMLPAGAAIHTQFRAPDVVPGITGSAWRSDGFSSYAETALSLDPTTGFTLSLWLALESYPSDREVPVNELVASSIAQQALNDSGFDLDIDTFGRWGFRVATAAGVVRVPAPARFPLLRWVHIVSTVDTASGTVSIYQDRTLVASSKGVPGMSLKLASAPLRLATPPVLARILDFKINRLNAAYDLVAVYPAALNAAQLALLPGPAPTAQVPDAAASLIVPETRFAADHQRPRVHALPPAGWTNEPHGLVRFGDLWHMFYQRTPNGPFKTQMHWGHMASRDLVSWQHLPDALRPELQNDSFGFDMKGIWSGHVIVDGGKAFAFYTSVNHGDRLAASNPGIAMAISEDPQLRDWRKLGPLINTRGVKDFRDPYLWQEGNKWHMVIGAARDSGGGLEYHVLERADKGAVWRRQRRFMDPADHILDIGSEIWEMPVFEPLSDGVSILVVNPIGGKVSKYGDPSTRAVYWTGEWSGGVFKPFFRTPKLLDLVPGHLAPTVGRAADGKLRAIGIIDERRNPASQERAGWANTFGLPRVWSLLPDKRTLGQAPAPELLALRGERRLARTGLAIGKAPVPLANDLHAYELLVELDPGKPLPGPLTIEVMASADGREATRLQFDAAHGRVTVDKRASTLQAAEGEGPQLLHGDYAAEAFGAPRSLRVFVDGSTIEVFINDAAVYAVRSYPSLPGSTQVSLSVDAAQPALADVQLWPLRIPTR